MILPDKKDAIHKAWLYRTLKAVCDNEKLVEKLCFKGGTCAAMRGFLDRFSVDLDFDFIGNENEMDGARKELEKVFVDLGLEIKEQSQKIPQYFLKYDSPQNVRNTLKIDMSFPIPKTNKCEPTRLIEIDRIIKCQTIETMFANKLVALIERFEKGNSIAGRDIYDIHYFFLNGYKYDPDVIKERRAVKDLKIFFQQLIEFVQKNITQELIDQDINFLLLPEKFRKIRKVIKDEVLIFLNDEAGRAQH